MWLGWVTNGESRGQIEVSGWSLLQKSARESGEVAEIEICARIMYYFNLLKSYMYSCNQYTSHIITSMSTCTA